MFPWYSEFFGMFTPELIAGMHVFGATLTFVTICLSLTKTLAEAGILKKS